MANKTYTILVSSNRRGKTRSTSITSAWLKTGVGLAILAGMILVAGVVDYLSLLSMANENKVLLAENKILRGDQSAVRDRLNTLETNLDRVNDYYTKLKLITNVEDEDRSLKLAMGGTNETQKAMSEYTASTIDRAPSSEFLIKTDPDSQFFKKAPLDEAKRELHKLSQNEFASLSIRIERAMNESSLREQGVISLYSVLSERQSLLNATPNIKPARGWFTSRFGYRIDPFTNKPTMHAGLDIAAAPGTPVYSPADGLIVYVGYESGYGKLVTIDHGYGVKSRFAHNSQVFVEVGQRVSRRDVISAVGSTGRSSGPHLHYEIRVHGVPVDPINYILNEN